MTSSDTHGYAVLISLKAVMTSEPSDISNAITLLQSGINAAYHYRKKDSTLLGALSTFVRGMSVESMTRLQRHAELIYAEMYLIKALLTIISDESFVSFIREGINIRNSYVTYRQCLKWLEKSSRDQSLKTEYRKRSASEPSALLLSRTYDPHFISGIRLGIGMFNLLLSLLPGRVLKIFEAIGFGGSRSFALEQLCSPDIRGGVREFVCELALLAYHTIVTSHIAFLEPDWDLSRSLVEKHLTLFPDGAFSLFFAGRYAQITGNMPSAIEYYSKSIQSQRYWVQLHHVCHWNLAFCYSAQLDYAQAWRQIQILERDSKWSKAIYTYLTAAYQYMSNLLGSETNDMEAIIDQMKRVPTLLRRIAGRSIPMEKFVSRKSRKFIMQDNRLLLPGFELSIIWNAFEHIPVDIRQKALLIVDKTLSELHATPVAQRHANYYDDYCLAYFIKGLILRELSLEQEALENFHKILAVEKLVKLDHYLIPFARYELGRTYLGMVPSQREAARVQFESARKNYSKFSLENNLHLRVHNAMKFLDRTSSDESIEAFKN
jgi:tetratricopeptide (TPR) repeat protein